MNLVNTALYRSGFRLAGRSVLAALLISASSLAWAQTVTVEPDSPIVGNCYPFGLGDGTWGPYMGFVYQDVPAFDLAPGDTLAFDLGEENDVAIGLQIEMAPATGNGASAPAGAFTTVVSNTQTPANPRGDEAVGNYELAFTAEGGFSFAGGGLIIRFSNTSPGYQSDSSCTSVMVHGTQADSSGFFVERFWQDSDGLPPYERSSTEDIAAFRIVASGSRAVPTTPLYALLLLAGGLAALVAVRRRG